MMPRDDALDLIPLYAGGDLDEASTALMDGAVEAYSECAQLLEGYEDLEALLVAELTPEPGDEPEWVREALLAGSSPDLNSELTATASSLDVGADDAGRDPIVGKVIGDCRVVRKLGAGGMGVVYLAEHQTLSQPAVLKILNPALTGNEETVARFFREAQACAQLTHPSIVSIYDVGQDDPYYFIRMEYVEGETLEELLARTGPLPWQRAIEICSAVADGLNHAHQRGMIHRDIKPENLMLTPEGETRVMDFGLARHVHGGGGVSATGQIVGTPYYMSPEQAGGKPTDARSDIYSLGVTLYYLVTGVKPFMGKNLQEIFLKHFFYAPESPKVYVDDLPEAFCKVVMRCLKKKKKERYQSAKALARDLRAVLRDPSAPLAVAPRNERIAPADPARTVKVSSAAEGTPTVQVGGEAATVQVNPDEGATVVAKSKPEPAGMFASASQVFAPEAHELELPATRPTRPEAPPPPKRRRSRRFKLMLAAGCLLVPTAFFGGHQLSASARLAELQQDEAALRQETMKAIPSDELALRWRNLGGAYLAMANDVPLAPNVADDALERSAGCLSEGERIAQNVAAADPIELPTKPEADLITIRWQLGQILEQYRVLRERAKHTQNSDLMQNLTEQGLAAYDLVQEWGERYPELEGRISDVIVPVQVTSDPGGAQIFMNVKALPEPQRTPPGGTGIVWVRPRERFRVLVSLRGYQTWKSRQQVADRFRAIDAPLTRKMMRGPFSLTDVKGQPEVPVHTPAVEGGNAYYVNRNGVLRGLRLDRLQFVGWGDGDYKVGLYLDPTPPLTVSDEVILVSSRLGTLSARDRSSGAEIWKADISSPLSTRPVHDREGRVIAAGTQGGEVVFVSEAGRVLWRYATRNAIGSAPYLRDDLCYVGSSDDQLYVLDWKAKKRLASLNLGSDVVLGPVPFGAPRAAAPRDRRLLVGTRDGKVHLIDVVFPKKPQIIVTLDEDEDESGPVRGLVTTADGVVCVSAGKTLAAYRPVSGRTEWTFSSVRKLMSPVLNAEAGLVYVCDDGGLLHAIDAKTGEERWLWSAPRDRFGKRPPIEIEPLLVDDELYVFAANRVYVLPPE